MRKILFSQAFEDILSKFLEKNPFLKERVWEVFNLLSENVFAPSLRTHKLHGRLSKLYACKIDYGYRLLFSIDKSFIHPHTIGTHTQVYKSN